MYTTYRLMRVVITLLVVFSSICGIALCGPAVPAYSLVTDEALRDVEDNVVMQ